MKLKLVSSTKEYSELYKINQEKRLERGDSGVDIYLPNEIEIPPNSFGNKVSLGIRCQPYDKVGYFLLPRSSLSKTPIRLGNSVGLIDHGYTGEICAFVDNISSKPFVLEKGRSYFQLVSADLKPITLDIVNELNPTLRGEGGFGSTSSYISKE